MNDAAANLLLVMSVCLVVMAALAIRKGLLTFLLFMAFLAAIYVIMYGDTNEGKPAPKEPDISILSAAKEAWSKRSEDER